TIAHVCMSLRLPCCVHIKSTGFTLVWTCNGINHREAHLTPPSFLSLHLVEIVPLIPLCRSLQERLVSGPAMDQISFRKNLNKQINLAVHTPPRRGYWSSLSPSPVMRERNSIPLTLSSRTPWIAYHLPR